MKKINGVEIVDRWAEVFPWFRKYLPSIADMIVELSRAEAQVATLSMKPEDIPVRCLYCDEIICTAKNWDPEVPKHMAACEKNPLKSLFKRNAELVSNNASIKAEYEATMLANGRLQAENARLKNPVSEEEVIQVMSTEPHPRSRRQVAQAIIAARAGKGQDNG